MAPFRLAIISTPRSGNTWLRRLTADAFALTEIATHRPLQIGLNDVPERAVIQAHWRRDPPILELFAELGCRVVTLVRHPLDVYVSVVRFCAVEPETALWLLGENGDERVIAGCGPNDDAAIAYGQSSRFQSLLSVTAEWSDAAILLRYEEAARDPAGMLERLADSVGEVVREPVKSLIDRYSFERLHVEHPHHHAVGPNASWSDVLTETTIEALVPTLRWHLDRFGYSAKEPSQ